MTSISLGDTIGPTLDKVTLCQILIPFIQIVRPLYYLLRLRVSSILSSIHVFTQTLKQMPTSGIFFLRYIRHKIHHQISGPNPRRRFASLVETVLLTAAALCVEDAAPCVEDVVGNGTNDSVCVTVA